MASPDADKQRAMRAIQAMFDRYLLIASQRHGDFDFEVMNNLKIVDAGADGSVSFELYMAPKFSNLNDVMHGGAAGVIFDMATTSALCPVAQPGYWEFMGGVTRSLNISYLKAVPIGITVRLNSKVTSVGKQMAMIRGDMTSLDGKITYCTVEHHKVNVPVRAIHAEARIPWDEEWEAYWNSKKPAQKPKSKI